MKKSRGFERRTLRSLAIDARTQRATIPARVRSLARRFDIDKVGILTVSVRDGVAYIVDGQHRYLAALEAGYADEKVPCYVYHNLSEPEEAELFLALNDARAVSPLDRYEVGLVAGDPTCLGVQAILNRWGLTVSRTCADGKVQCISKIMAMYERDPALLEVACAVIIKAWGTKRSALEQVIFGGMAQVLGRYNGELDKARLIERMAKYSGGPSALIGHARGLKDFRNVPVTRAAAEIMVDAYNKGLRANTLPPL